MRRAKKSGLDAKDPPSRRWGWGRLISAASDARLERVVIVLGALVCLLWVATLRDVRWSWHTPSQASAPSLPDNVGTRDAVLHITAVDEQHQPVAGARAEVFAMVDDVAHLEAVGTTDGQGKVTLGRLARGETWLVVRSADHARASSRLALEAGDRELALTLAPAHFFEVVTVDGMQRPIRGVTVRLFGADPVPYLATTDARGLARLEQLGPPPYAVEVQARGYDSKLLPQLGLDDSPVFVKLEALGVLEVAVVEPSSGDGNATSAQPAAGATVKVAGSGLWPARTATTDERGHVTIAGLPRGFYDLRAERDELVSDSELGVMLERGETKEVELRLVPGSTVTVKVTDGDGPDAAPIAKADVALVEGGISSFPLYGRTDAAGLCRLGPVAGRDATVSVRADGFVPRSAVPLEEGQSELQVGLSRGAEIVGRVVDEQDYPVEGVSLEVAGIDFDGMPIAESSTLTEFREDHFAFALPGAVPLVPVGELGVMPIVPEIPAEHGGLVVSRSSPTAEPWVSRADGGFELRPVTPGRVHLVASHPDYVETVTETLRLDAGKQAELKIVLRHGGLLEGRVVEEDGSPVGGARVEIASPEGAIERVTFAADDGSFAFAAVSPRIHVSVARPESPETLVTRLGLNVPAGERAEVEIVLPERRDLVTVRVTDDRGYSLDRVEVHALSLEPDAPLRVTRFTDDGGEAVIEDARGLGLRLVLQRTGEAPLVAQIDAAPERLELTMDRALTARGEVRDDGGPVDDASVTLYTPTGVRHARSDADGAFVLDNLAATPVRLLVHKAGHVPKEVRAEIAGDPERPVELGVIELTAGGTVEGEVLDPRDDPIAGALLAVGRVPTYLPLGPLPLGIAVSDRAGHFVLHDVEPGVVSVEAYVAGLGRASLDRVLVRADETTGDLKIVLEQQPEAPDKPEGGGNLAVTLADTLLRGKRVVYLEHVPQGGEAERAGIEPGDQLLAVDGVPVRTIGDARRRLGGPLSEDVLLLLAREPDLRWLTRVPRERLRR